jgi:hypothetical protein
VEQVRAIVADAIERLRAVLDGLDAPGGMPDGDEVDDVGQDASDPTSIGIPGGSGEVPETEEPNQPTATGRPSAGPACPPAPPPMPPAPRPAASPALRKHSFFDVGL